MHATNVVNEDDARRTGDGGTQPRRKLEDAAGVPQLMGFFGSQSVGVGTVDLAIDSLTAITGTFASLGGGDLTLTEDGLYSIDVRAVIASDNWGRVRVIVDDPVIGPLNASNVGDIRHSDDLAVGVTPCHAFPFSVRAGTTVDIEVTRISSSSSTVEIYGRILYHGSTSAFG